jgi:hypothetical protein
MPIAKKLMAAVSDLGPKDANQARQICPISSPSPQEVIKVHWDA